MPTNIHIGISGSANTTAAQAQLDKLTAKFAMLDKEMHATMLSGKQTSGQLNKDLSAIGRQFAGLAANTGNWQTVQKRVNDQTVQLTDNLIKQKATYKDIAAARKSGLLEMARQEQLRLRSAQVSTLGRTPAGQNYAQMLIPSGVTDGMDNLAKKVGFQSALLKSASTQMVNFGKNTQWAGRQLSVGFTVPLIAAGAATAFYAFQADKALTRVAKVYDTTVHANLSLSQQQVMKEKELAQLRVDGMTTAKNAAKQYGASMQDTLATQGDLAATGQKGQELQKATNQTMRLATLGEMDYATATQASISLQQVFGQNSEDLTKTFNYMNAVENQTSLSMQDFATAIPIAAAPIKALGGSVKDLGTLLVAMKSRGIDAAEGANAIKSSFTRLLNPSKMVQKQFKEMTGVDIVKLVDSTKGQLIPTFKALGDSVENLDKLGKARVLGKLFGTYQNTRINAMMTGITEDMDNANTQVGRAVQLAHANDAKLAGIADSELKQVQQSASGRLKIAVESIKVDLAGMGQTFLKSSVDILNGAENVIEAFHKLPGPVKEFLKYMILIIAAIGPLAMLTGLFFNMAGTVGKAAGSVGMLLTRFKLLNRDSVLGEKAAAAATTAMDRQTKSVDSLAQAIAELNTQLLQAARANGALVESTNTAMARKGIAAQTASLKDQGARVNQNTGNVSMPMVSSDGRTRRTNIQGNAARYVKNADYKYTQNAGVPFANVQTLDEAHAEANRINNGKNQQAELKATRDQVVATKAAETAERKRSQAINASKIGAGLFTASLVASLVPLGEGNKTTAAIKKDIVQWGMAAGLFLPIIGNVTRAMAAARATSGGIGAAFASSTMVKNAKNLGSSIALAARNGEGLRGKVSGVSKVLAGGKGLLNPWVLGLAAAGAGAFVLYKHLSASRKEQEKINNDASGLAKIFGFTELDEGTTINKQGVAVKTLNEKIKELNEEYPKLASNIRNASGEQNKFLLAAQQGVKAFNKGASVEQAKEIVIAALRAGGKTAEQAKVIVLKFGFDPKNVDMQVQIASKKFNDGLANSLKFHWNPFGDHGDDDIKTSAKSIATSVKTALENNDVSGAASAGASYIKKVNAEIAKRVESGDLSKEEAGNLSRKLLEAYGQQIGADKDSYKKLGKQVSNSIFDGARSKEKGTYLTIDNFIKLDPSKTLKSTQDIKKALANAKAAVADYQNAINNLSKGKPITPWATDKDSMNYERAALKALLEGKTLTKDQRIEISRIQSALGLRKLTEAQILAVLNAQKGAVSDQAKMSPAVVSARKSLLAGLQASLDGLDKENEAESTALDRRQQAASAAMEAAQRRQESLFDKQQTAMENRQEAAQHAFDKRWDARIKKAQDEEALRQKLFDNERNRIQRLAELQNANINFNAALQAGNLDEAARVQNTQRASTETNNLDDLDKTLGDKATAKQDKLSKQRDDEAYTLKRHQEFEKQAFDATKKRYEDQAAAAKAAAEAGFQAEKDALAKAQAARKANIEAAIAAVNAFHGKSQKSWDIFLEGLKAKYGTFSGAAGKALQAAMDKAFGHVNKDADDLSSPRKWGPRGADAYQAWVDATTKKAKAQKLLKEVSSAVKHIFAGFANHEGGMAFSGRTGYPSAAAPYPSEHLRLLKNDEYVMKGSAVRAYGKSTFDEMNKAKPNVIKSHHEGGMAGAVTTMGGVPMESFTAGLFQAASASNKKKQAALNASGTVGSGASMAGVDPKGWNKPWAGHHTTSNGHDYNLVYKPLYAPHTGTLTTHAIPGHEPRVSSGGLGFRSYGQWLDFNGGGTNLMFAHLSKLPWKAGGKRSVKAGQYMGTTGATGNATGPHVHVERNHTGDNGQFGAFFRAQHVQLRKGGELKYDQKIDAHAGETVLTKGLTEKFKAGVSQLANGNNTEYNINVDAKGATQNDADRIAQKVVEKIRFEKSRKGNNR